MKALTLWQPWSYAVAHLDKRIENRTWMPPQNIIGERIAIHAGRTLQTADVAELNGQLGILLLHEMLPLGAVESVATVAGYVTHLRDDHPQRLWLRGPCGWVLEDVVPLREPVPCAGRQGLWDLPAFVRQKVEAQL